MTAPATYAEWEAKAGISPVSREAYHAENAWNAAVTATQADLVDSLTMAERVLAASLNACGYKPGSCTDEWVPEVREQVAALAKIRATLAKAGAEPVAPERRTAPRNRFVRKLIDNGVRNLHEFGYPACTAENITTDSVFGPLFATMLRENKGQGMDYDEAIDALLVEIEGGAA